MDKQLIMPLSKDEVAALKPADLAKFIDHTMLKADATTAAIEQLCSEAHAYHFYSVCVNSARVAQAATRLKGSSIKVCAVVGFPLGAMSSASKAFEAKDAIEHGADEVDMVLDIGAFKSRGLLDDRAGHSRRQGCGPGG